VTVVDDKDLFAAHVLVRPAVRPLLEQMIADDLYFDSQFPVIACDMFSRGTGKRHSLSIGFESGRPFGDGGFFPGKRIIRTEMVEAF
jgi:hypothetical protein